ncbi:MAG TPA: SRPBCC family protein, partial [Chthoniobacterales bacterium]|nr:SRPBCC family protein [Chthoniobacterales bacterium]
MNQVNCITIHAPLHKIFLAASDLTRWPEFLPHYRHNRFLSQTPSGGVVKMSSIHAGIPLSGIQEFRIDPERRE